MTKTSCRTATREADLTCQSPDCVPVVSSHILEHWAHPSWHRSSGGWSQASERHRVPLERKAGSCLLRGGASAAVESGLTERERRRSFVFLGIALWLFLFLSVLFGWSPLPPEYPCAAGISVPLLPPVGRRFCRRAATPPGCLSPG